MKLKPYKIEDTNYFKKTKNLMLLEEFIASNEKCCEVVDYDHIDAKSCYWSIKSSIKRFGFGKIIVTTEKGRVFLIRDDKR